MENGALWSSEVGKIRPPQTPTPSSCLQQLSPASAVSLGLAGLAEGDLVCGSLGPDSLLAD